MMRLDSSLFNWLNWEAGTIHELGIECRYHSITSARGKAVLRKYTYGYCPGERLICRPKAGEVAVMVHKEGRDFWFHLRRKEFEEIFPECVAKI